jgi:hypothetical protein
MREIGLIERIESDPNHTKPSPPFKSSRALSLLRFPHASSILCRSVQSRLYEYPKLFGPRQANRAAEEVRASQRVQSQGSLPQNHGDSRRREQRSEGLQSSPNDDPAEKNLDSSLFPCSFVSVCFSFFLFSFLSSFPRCVPLFFPFFFLS